MAIAVVREASDFTLPDAAGPEVTLSQLRGAPVGPDRSGVFAHRASREQEGSGHSLLADVKAEVARKGDTWNEAASAAKRATVAIDRQRRIASDTRNPIPNARAHPEVASRLV